MKTQEVKAFYSRFRRFIETGILQSQVDAIKEIIDVMEYDELKALAYNTPIDECPLQSFEYEDDYRDIYAAIDRLTPGNKENRYNAINAIILVMGGAVVRKMLNIRKGFQITEEQLRKIYPKANTEFVQYINKYSAMYGIDTKVEMAGFLSNTLHESAGFNKLRENMNYRPNVYLKVFRRRVKTLANAKHIVSGGKKAIANHVYNGRGGNRKGTDDGYNYRGGGLMHTTFRNNYRNTGEAIGVDLESNPELISTPEIAVKAAMWYWNKYKCNEACSTGDIKKARRIVNGGYNGWLDVRRLHNKAMKVL